MTATEPTTEAKPVTIVAAIQSALDVALGLDERVIILGEDIADPIGGVMKATKGLSTTYGTDRVRATPIVEQTIVGTAVGAALGGYRPVAEIMFMDFMCQAMDQIINHAAKSRYMSGGHSPAPIVVRAMIGDAKFGAQHSQALEAWFMHTPGLKVVMPSNPYDTKGLLLSAIFDDDPVIFIENMSMSYAIKGPVPDGDYRIPIGEAATVRSGSDVTTCLASAAKTKRAIIVHGSTQFCGPGAELATQLNDELFDVLEAPVARLGATFTPVPFSQELHSIPTTNAIVDAVVALHERTVTGSDPATA